MDKFETWWEREGQEFLFALNTTTDDDIKLVAEIAWKNGAYCAEQEEQEPVGWNDLDDHELAEKLGWRIGDPLYMTAVGLGQEAIHHFKAKNAAPIRTKDLTDDEIWDALASTGFGASCYEDARAVIAADRSKNGII